MAEQGQELTPYNNQGHETELVPQVKDTMVGKHQLGTIQPASMTLAEFEQARRAELKRKSQDKKDRDHGSQERGHQRPSAANVESYRGSWGNPSGDKQVSGPTAEELAQFLGTRAHEQHHQPDVTRLRSIKPGQEHSVWHGWSHDASLKTILEPVHPLPEAMCRVPRKLVHTWTGHTQPVQVIRMLGSHLLVSGGHDARVKIWSAGGEPWECLRTLYGHNKPLRDLCLQHDRHLITMSHERTIQRWEVEEGVVDGSLTVDSQPVACQARGEDSLYVATVEGVVRQWDTRQGSFVHQFGIPRVLARRKKRRHAPAVGGEEEEEIAFDPKQGHDGPISCFSLLSDNYLATAGEDQTLRLWDLRYTQAQAAESLPVKTIELDYLPTAMLAHGNNLCLQSAKNAIHTFILEGGMLNAGRRRYVGHVTDGHGCQMAISPDGKWLASGSADGKLVIWDWRSGQLSRRLEAHERAMHGVQWSPLGTHVATCSWDGTIKLWE